MKVEYANGLIYTGNLIYDEKFQNFLKNGEGSL